MALISHRTLIIGAMGLLLHGLPAAANKPCSGKAGGVNRCENGRFICNDGRVSQSKKVCVAAGSSRQELDALSRPPPKPRRQRARYD